APHGGVYDCIMVDIQRSIAIQRTPTMKQMARYSLADLWRLPHTGKTPRPALVYPETEESSSDTDQEGYGEHWDYVEGLTEDLARGGELPDATSTLFWEEGTITVRTREWSVDTTRWGTRVRTYVPGTTPQAKFDCIKLHINDRWANQLDGDRTILATIPLTLLRRLPHIGKRPRNETGSKEPEADDSSTESEEEEEDTATVIGQRKDKIILRTRRWFEEGCRDPNCEQDAQHLHKHFSPTVPEKGEYAEVVLDICRKRDCGMIRTSGPHAHQRCKHWSIRTLPMSYIKRLPRQDTPEVERHAKGLDAIDEAISDFELDNMSKNDKAVARGDA
ncbi:MAG: hypothetical protein Q9198_010723, partial [Flavoplaca austrocitrina]